MEIRRVTEGGLQRDPTRRLIHASPTRIKNSPAVNVTQKSATATLARKVPAAYLLPNCDPWIFEEWPTCPSGMGPVVQSVFKVINGAAKRQGWERTREMKGREWRVGRDVVGGKNREWRGFLFVKFLCYGGAVSCDGWRGLTLWVHWDSDVVVLRRVCVTRVAGSPGPAAVKASEARTASNR